MEITLETTEEIDVQCAVCGSALDHQYVDRDTTLYAEPCRDCAEKEYQEGYDEGYDVAEQENE